MFGIEDYTQKIVDFSNFDPSQLLDALAFGGAMLLIGMLAVFSVLVILWFCLVLFKLAFHDIPLKKSRTEAPKEATPAPVVTAAKSTDDGEIIAAIAAAIAMAESEGSGMKFKVVSFRRK